MSKLVSGKKFTLEVRAFLETRSNWAVSVSSDSDPIFSFIAPPIMRTPVGRGGVDSEWTIPTSRHNVLEVRDRLFAVDDPKAALAFFKAYGPWRCSQTGDSASPMRLSQLLLHRDLRSAFLLSGTTAGAFMEPRMSRAGKTEIAGLFDLTAATAVDLKLLLDKQIVAVANCRDVEEATQAAVLLGRLEGFGWYRCGRCGGLFAAKTRRQPKFCSKSCRSAMSSRYYEKRKKATPNKPSAKRVRAALKTV